MLFAATGRFPVVLHYSLQCKLYWTRFLFWVRIKSNSIFSSFFSFEWSIEQYKHWHGLSNWTKIWTKLHITLKIRAKYKELLINLKGNMLDLKSFDSFSVFGQLVESGCILFKYECKVRIYTLFYFCFTQVWDLSETFCSFEIKFSVKMFAKCAHKLVIYCELIYKRIFFLFQNL